MSDADRWLSTTDACAKLGVRPQTLYAYVSRGLLTPRREGRRSFFLIDELEMLEPRGKRTMRPGRIEVAIDSAVTLLESEGRLFYRGIDIQAIASTWSFERVAELLWSGVDGGEPKQWPVAVDSDAPGRTLTERVRNAMASLAVNAPEADSRPAVATSIGRRLLPQLVASLPRIGKCEEAARAPLAQQLWPRLTDLASSPERIAALNCALIAFADHQLVRSTIAARFAASSEAPPLDAVLAAMATHSGVARHGFRTSMEEALRAGGEPPGAYDHVAYEGRDPRADALVPLIQAASSPSGWRLVQLAITDERPPNADLALAALTVACEMAPTAAEAIYTLARTAGLLAHIAEEYDHPSAFRPTVGYRGPVPSEYLGEPDAVPM